MLSATCHCGAVRISIPRRPRTITNCSCSICRRYGVLWAYFPSDTVRLEHAIGAVHRYAWGKVHIRFVRCANCGCVMCWERTATGPGRMGVNARNFDPADLGAVRIRRLDGAVNERYLD